MLTLIYFEQPFLIFDETIFLKQFKIKKYNSTV